MIAEDSHAAEVHSPTPQNLLDIPDALGSLSCVYPVRRLGARSLNA